MLVAQTLCRVKNTENYLMEQHESVDTQSLRQMNLADVGDLMTVHLPSPAS